MRIPVSALVVSAIVAGLASTAPAALGKHRLPPGVHVLAPAKSKPKAKRPTTPVFRESLSRTRSFAVRVPRRRHRGAARAAAGTGGVNTGLPGSTCAADNRPATTAPGAGVSTTGLGAAAPAYYEVGSPTGAYAGQSPKGVMIAIHGGGWYTVGPGAVEAERPEADRWRARGWQTVNITYGACDKSVGDALTFYDLVRAAYPSSRICATGGSAGGHLALMIAAKRPDLACVISEGGPTDLAGLANESAAGSRDGPTWVYNVAVAAFGKDNLAANSPVALASSTHARLLLANATGDNLVPAQQLWDLQAAHPNDYTDVRVLDGGTSSFVHAPVAPAALSDFFLREQNLVAPITGDPPGECAMCGAGAGWRRTSTAAPLGVLAELTSMNDVSSSCCGKVGDLRMTVDYTAAGGTFSIAPASILMAAGSWRIQTCYGAMGADFKTWNKCDERQVTTTQQSWQNTLPITIAFLRPTHDFQWIGMVQLYYLVDGKWTSIANSYHGSEGSGLPVPGLGKSVL